MCPLKVARATGGCFLSVFGVKPGNPFTYPFSSACWSVDKTGDHIVAWENSTISGALVGIVTAFV